MMTKRLFTAALLLLSGCSGTHQGWSSPRHADSLNKPIVAQPDVEKRYRWARVAIGALPRPTPYGFVREQSLGRDDPGGVEGEVREVHWVYDRDFRIVGCIGPNGSTTRFGTGDGREDLGNMRRDDAIRAIFDVRGSDDVHFLPLPASGH